MKDEELLPDIFDDEAEKPEPVRAAEAEVRSWGLGLAVAGGVGSIWYWMLVVDQGVILPLTWLFLFLVALLVVYYVPPTRGPRLARNILRRWDQLRVEHALDGAGASAHPQVQVGMEMAGRIVRHPGADEASRESAARLLHALRVTARDRRTVELMRQARMADVARPDRSERSLSDVLDFLDAREGELLTSLERLHRAVLQRDSAAVAQLRGEADEVLERLAAEADVERLLDSSTAID